MFEKEFQNLNGHLKDILIDQEFHHHKLRKVGENFQIEIQIIQL
jgi:hypothetical protein